VKKRGKGPGYRTPDWFKGKVKPSPVKGGGKFEPKGQTLEAKEIRKK
jgi:hypothetical protein